MPSQRHGDRARVRDVRLARRPAAAARHGLHRAADRLGRRRSASCSPTAASTSSASTTATAACRPSSTASTVDLARRASTRRMLDRRRAARRCRTRSRHGRRRVGLLDHLGIDARARRRGVDGRDDRPDHRDRAPDRAPVADVDHVHARRVRKSAQPTPEAVAVAAGPAAGRPRGVHRQRRPSCDGLALEEVLRRRRGPRPGGAPTTTGRFYPEGAPRQLAAIYASGRRAVGCCRPCVRRRSSSTVATTRSSRRAAGSAPPSSIPGAHAAAARRHGPRPARAAVAGARRRRSRRTRAVAERRPSRRRPLTPAATRRRRSTPCPDH